MRLPVFDRRRAGVLLPISALEAALGRGGRAFIDWLAAAGFSVWQILPVGPTGADGSPYWVRSDCAGNAAFLDPAELPAAGADRCAVPRRERGLAPGLRALRGAHACARRRAVLALAGAAARPRAARARAGARHARRRARRASSASSTPSTCSGRGCARTPRGAACACSATCRSTSRPPRSRPGRTASLFQLTPGGAPAKVGGVPPDYFSAMGQLWGNPLYDWQALRGARTSPGGWRACARSSHASTCCASITSARFAAHWAVPAGAPDARGGAWRTHAGSAAAASACGTSSATCRWSPRTSASSPTTCARSCATSALPGMRVLQFGFDGDPGNPHMPYRHERDCVAYTGTHDNDTTLGWYASLDAATRARVDFYCAGGAMPEALIRAALDSVAELAVMPMQDLLGLRPRRASTPPARARATGSGACRRCTLGRARARCAQLNRASGAAERNACSATIGGGDESPPHPARRVHRGARRAPLAGCAATHLETPKLSVVDVEVLGGELWQQHLRVRMHVHNPNDRALPIKAIEYTLEVQGQPFASGESERDLRRAGARGRRVRHERDHQPRRRPDGRALPLRRLPVRSTTAWSARCRSRKGSCAPIPFDQRGVFKLH